MRKGKSIIGLSILSQSDATDLGKVRDLIFDHDTDELLALLVSEKDLFGLIDAQIIPWSEVKAVGPSALMVRAVDSRIKAGDFPRVKEVMNRETALSGTRIVTADGREIGTLADMYVDDESGKIVGYEVSGGFLSDTMSGKRFMEAIPAMPIGRGVAVVPSEVADQFEQQKATEPGGLSGAAQSVSNKFSGAVDSTKGAVAGAYDSTRATVTSAYDSAKTTATETYASVASSSIEKQKEFIVGKPANRDVALPAPANAGPAVTDEEVAPAETPTRVLVRQGETITREHADEAERAGILGTLLLAAGNSVTAAAYDTTREKVATGAATASTQASGLGATVQQKAEGAALGKRAGKEVTAPNGETIVAPGQTITQEMIDRAKHDGRDKELLASAGFGAATAGVESVKESATSLWGQVKAKAAEFSGAAQDKKAEHDAAAEQAKINNALGRPVTRVILDRADAVILNIGDLITHAAVDRAREAGTLPILLDSVYVADPEITPDMMRAKDGDEVATPSPAPAYSAAQTVALDKQPEALPEHMESTVR